MMDLILFLTNSLSYKEEQLGLSHKRRSVLRLVITGQSYDVRSTQILESLNWMPIEDTLKKREIIMTFKALTNRLPDYVQNSSRDAKIVIIL